MGKMKLCVTNISNVEKKSCQVRVVGDGKLGSAKENALEHIGRLAVEDDDDVDDEESRREEKKGEEKSGESDRGDDELNGARTPRGVGVGSRSRSRSRSGGYSCSLECLVCQKDLIRLSLFLFVCLFLHSRSDGCMFLPLSFFLSLSFSLLFS